MRTDRGLVEYSTWLEDNARARRRARIERVALGLALVVLAFAVVCVMPALMGAR